MHVNHPSDEDLLLALDGELPALRRARIRLHLDACWTCRTRLRDIENTVDGFTRAYHREFGEVPPAEGPRALLKARLGEFDNSRQSWWRTEWSLAVASFAIVILAAFAGIHAFGRLTHPSRARATPLASLTPGAFRTVSNDEVCAAARPEDSGIVPDSLKREVFIEYGMGNVKQEAFEVDYLVTPELGGARDIRNLWPQPYGSVVWNAHVKDALENRLHEMVCSGEIDLATAQRDLSNDWISAYKKYFHRESPL